MTQKTITYCDKPECGKEVLEKYYYLHTGDCGGFKGGYYFCPTHAEELEKMFGIKIKK